MAFDELLAARIRKRLGKRAGLTERQMFGGFAFLLNGNMCCGVHGSEMIIRLDPAKADDALTRPGTRRFDLTGRPMKGWVLVGQPELSEEDALDRWIALGIDYAESLPPK
jgi:TfoX/Sxy family transcriptional regulator of competence genes